MDKFHEVEVDSYSIFDFSVYDIQLKVLYSSNDIKKLFVTFNLSTMAYVVGVGYGAPKTIWKYFDNKLVKSLTNVIQLDILDITLTSTTYSLQ